MSQEETWWTEKGFNRGVKSQNWEETEDINNQPKIHRFQKFSCGRRLGICLIGGDNLEECDLFLRRDNLSMFMDTGKD